MKENLNSILFYGTKTMHFISNDEANAQIMSPKQIENPQREKTNQPSLLLLSVGFAAALAAHDPGADIF
jgi:hypothetical protein